jgi:4-aminobutyrate aminotransferase
MPVKIGAKTKKIIERDRNIMLASTRESFPFVAERAEGDYAIDIEGNRFIDFSSFIGVYNLGVNGNAQVRKAIKDQVDRLMHAAFLDFYSELPVRYAENLMTMFPKGFGRAFFSNSGTEAIEDAIKLSKIFTKRHHLIAFYNAFHGRSMGSLSLTCSRSIQRAHLGPFVSVSHAPYPNPYRCANPSHHDNPEECAKESIDFIEKNILGSEVPPEEVAAIFLEPIQGEGGYIVPPKGFFKMLRELADKHGILLVDDEIQAGFMRTGKFLALDNFGVAADIYTMSKSLGSGIPFAATISRRSLGNVKAGEHAGTFGGNLLAVAGANAALNYVKGNMSSLQSQVRRKGGIIMKRLEEMKDKYEIVGDVRGVGMMIGMELVKDRKTKEYATEERNKALDSCFENGLLILPAGKSTIRIIPPLTISETNLNKGLDVLEEAIRRLPK